MWIIDENNKTPLYIQLYGQIKADISDGTLKAGTKLKSSREISAELHISRNTVELAYGQLYAEGFISSKPRRGYYVEPIEAGTFAGCEAEKDSGTGEGGASNIAYDFKCGKSLLSELPCNLWKRLTGRCFHEYRENLALQGSVFGETGLRMEIQKYIRHYRNVQCTAEQIVVAAGTQFCLGLASQLLKAVNGDAGIAMEEPGYDQSRVTFCNSGLQIYPAALDQHGLDINALAAMDAAAAYTTPSHQFPTGTVMPLSRRRELAQWAIDKDAYIIEDDYNCHFQHDLKPLPSIQSLCTDRVFYIGGFSDILFPCIRVSYMVVPENLIEKLHGWYDGYAPFVPFLTQKPLELFMKEGYWESHLRKMKKHQKEKSKALVNALRDKFGESIHISGFHAGLHLLVQARWPVKEEELVRRAYRNGIGVYPTSKYWQNPAENQNGTVLLNFGGISPADIPAAAELLYKAWRESGPGAMKDFDTGSFA